MFGAGSQIRKVLIKGKKISMMTGETGFTPMVMDLEKLTPEQIEKMKLDQQFMKELKLLKNENDMARDIIRDFNKTGWRVIKRKDG